MAAGVWVVPAKAKLNLFSSTDILNPALTFKITLHASAFTPDDVNNEVYADLANELATAFGYTNGGLALTSVTLTQSAGVVKFTSAAAVWNASGGSIPAWRYAYLRAIGTLNGKVDPIIAHFLADTTPADAPATTSGNPLTITMNASGIITAT